MELHYVWAVSAEIPLLQKKLNQSSFTCSTMFKIQIGWINTVTRYKPQRPVTFYYISVLMLKWMKTKVY